MRAVAYRWGLILISCYFSTTIKGQTKELKVGDIVPDLEFTTILGQSVGKAKLSDYKGKLVILDFWSTSCGPCIAAMPKMDSLQKHFGGRIKILPVISLKKITDSYKRHVDSFWRTNRFTSKTNLPTVIDTNLSKYFPHAGVPYEVWIDSNMILRGLTLADYVNKTEIKAILDGKIPDWEVANKTFYNYNQTLLNLKNDSKSSGKLKVSYSYFTNYLSKINSGKALISDTFSNSLRFCAINTPILTLYSQVLRYNDSIAYKWGDNRILLEITDSSKYLNIKKEYQNEWVRKNSFCYELGMPLPINLNDFYDCMRQDLNKYLKLNGRTEKRLVPCFALVRINKNEGYASSYTKTNTAKISSNANLSEEIVDSISDLLIKLNSERKNIPVIDETNYSGKVSFTFYLDPYLLFTDILSVRRTLRSKGFDLVYCKRNLDMFVISEVKN